MVNNIYKCYEVLNVALETWKFKDCHGAQSRKYANQNKKLVTEQLLSYNIIILAERSLKQDTLFNCFSPRTSSDDAIIAQRTPTPHRMAPGWTEHRVFNFYSAIYKLYKTQNGKWNK